MKNIKYLIVLSQLGRIWSRGMLERKVFQSMTAVGFFALFMYKKFNEEESNEYNEFNNKL